MSERVATTVVNGMLCRIEPGETVASLKQKAGVDPTHTLVRVSHATAEACRNKDEAIAGSKYRSIPPTTQGSIN